MKNNSLKFAALLLISVLAISGCTKKEDASPADVAKANIVRTWRVEPASITISGIPLATLLSQVPQQARPDYSLLRFTINADGTYRVSGADLAGVAATGTWAFDPATTAKIILNPGNVTADISNLTSSSMTLGYSFPTANSIYAALGSTAAVRANLVSP